MPPEPGSMSASSRTAMAEGMKNTTIASTHISKLASPNWLAAVVSQRRPTIAVRLNSTTSRRFITRGNCGWDIGPKGLMVDRGGKPADAGAQRRPTQHVGGKVLPRLDPHHARGQRRAI